MEKKYIDKIMRLSKSSKAIKELEDRAGISIIKEFPEEDGHRFLEFFKKYEDRGISELLFSKARMYNDNDRILLWPASLSFTVKGNTPSRNYSEVLYRWGFDLEWAAQKSNLGRELEIPSSSSYQKWNGEDWFLEGTSEDVEWFKSLSESQFLFWDWTVNGYYFPVFKRDVTPRIKKLKLVCK